jgi:hypothetical protein
MGLPTIAIGPHRISRMTIGGNPFGGFSHQNRQRDEEMLDYYSVARIKQTLADCEAAGINTCCLRTDAHIWRLLREYRNDGGKIQWIAQPAAQAIEFAFANIKPTDAVNVGMFTKDNPRMVQENVELALKAMRA